MRRREHGASALAETYACRAFAAAVPTQNDFVTVFQEPSALAVRQVQGLRATVCELEQASPTRLVRTRYGSGPEQVTRDQVAAVAGVMRNHLRDRPIRAG